RNVKNDKMLGLSKYDRQGRNANVENLGGANENRGSRRHWIHRVKARTKVARAGPRSNCSISQFRSEHSHRRRASRGPERRISHSRRIELPLLGRRGSTEFL